ncbi:MAG TPA: valine--tRNA ligase [Ignavibacteria bacterium]|nr:valine--tRNA ligase [Ignavibacteria bacterium]
MLDLPKIYNYRNSEKHWINFWEEKKFYYSKPNSSKEKYVIVIPPPNVTGVLHIGHILNNTIQDIYTRWKRMSGFEACWVPGIDHAGIATQIVVEKDLLKQGITKESLGREEFIKKVWEWKELKGGHILKQLRNLGASVDWSKERFTLDENLSKAVKFVFVDLFKKGLIYRGNRIVNWDPKTQTAVSDDEIIFREKKDKLYYIKYYLAGSENEFIPIATARPETMFGDVAVAVNPNDDRYKKFIGKKVLLPVVNKEIPVIADEYVDIEFGTGALKITPAHDINDFEIGKRHNLEIINVLTKDSKLNEHGLEYEGQDIFVVRKNVTVRLRELGNLIKEEEYIHNVAISEKSDAIIEPFMSEQWYVSMSKLAEPAIHAVESGAIKFHPEKWVKTYMHWMNNLQDWCISRQLWWGHQIPVWYHKTTGEIYCETEPPVDSENWERDPDVLDTWFSSWLWPFSVFGWTGEENKNNKDLKFYYPTDLLVTANEIIYLWVARMIIAGLEYMHDIPFRDVYFNSIIRDDQGRKMSKSLGNSPEPLDVMDKFGTDALRFTLVYLAPLGNDVLYNEQSTEIGRNFVTKIWNAGRFLIFNYNKVNSSDDYSYDNYKSDLSDKWILSRFNSTLQSIDKNLNSYRLNDYTKELYNFIWSDFCDWYIEFLKIKIESNRDSAGKIIEDAISLFINILKTLHPVMPFVTEELWHAFNPDKKDSSISIQEFPEFDNGEINENIEKEFEFLKEIVTSIRNLKAENGISLGTSCEIVFLTQNEDVQDLIKEFDDYIKKLCNVSDIKFLDDPDDVPKNSAASVHKDLEVYLVLEGLIDFAKQNEKIQKEIENLEKYLDNINKKLTNERFLEKASEEVVEKEREKREDTIDKLEKLKQKLEY